MISRVRKFKDSTKKIINWFSVRIVISNRKITEIFMHDISESVLASSFKLMNIPKGPNPPGLSFFKALPFGWEGFCGWLITWCKKSPIFLWNLGGQHRSKCPVFVFLGGPPGFWDYTMYTLCIYTCKIRGAPQDFKNFSVFFISRDYLPQEPFPAER